MLNEALEHQILVHPLLDIFWKSLMRAEARFISRYIPQRSNEERLTGHLVSEADNSICVLKERFQKVSQERYGETREIDFLYYDLSRGGHVEKRTGADLGFVVAVDLPDYPPLIRAFVFQAKKVNGHSQLDVVQYRTLTKNDESAAYLFYDMDTKRRTAPMVLPVSDQTLKSNFEEAEKEKKESFSLSMDDVMDGTPLSLHILKEMENLDVGRTFSEVKHAVQYFRDMAYFHNQGMMKFDGVIGIVSLGHRIKFEPNSDMGLEVST